MTRQRDWISTDEAAQEAGTSPQWIRRQVAEGRLRATVWLVSGRRTFRIRLADWEDFRARYSRSSDDPDWE